MAGERVRLEGDNRERGERDNLTRDILVQVIFLEHGVLESARLVFMVKRRHLFESEKHTS